MDHDAEDPQVGAAALFRFLSDNLSEIADRIARLEAHAGDMISTSPRRSELLVVLQDFDLVRQMMEDCARLCAEASREGEGRLHGLAGTLRLEALRCKLVGERGADLAPMRAPQSDEPDGAVDFFGWTGVCGPSAHGEAGKP
jgi:hypothetical protein